MCNHIPVREVRTRPREQGQSACGAAWLVKAPCDARLAASGRLHRQYDGSDQTPVDGFSRPLDKAEKAPASTNDTIQPRLVARAADFGPQLRRPNRRPDGWRGHRRIESV